MKATTSSKTMAPKCGSPLSAAGVTATARLTIVWTAIAATGVRRGLEPERPPRRKGAYLASARRPLWRNVGSAVTRSVAARHGFQVNKTLEPIAKCPVVVAFELLMTRSPSIFRCGDRSWRSIATATRAGTRILGHAVNLKSVP
jgi:hypothetical protein